MCLLVMVTGCSSNPKTNEIVNEEPEVLEEVEKEEHPVEEVADDIEEVSINILVYHFFLTLAIDLAVFLSNVQTYLSARFYIQYYLTKK